MAALGYIRDKLDLKYLLLFVLASVKEPLGLDDIIEAALTDGAITYFDASDAFYELVESGHVTPEGEDGGAPLYRISEHGREIIAASEKRLPQSVRRDAQKAALTAAARRKRDSLITCVTTPRADGAFTTRLEMRDDDGDIIKLELMVVSRSQGQLIESNFRANAESIYGSVLDALLKDYDGDIEQ
ncbi:MAG: DUF4364 family protein [Clostridiales bacterium]|nr:DUF4364 family protein [Clostridiales bacterium]